MVPTRPVLEALPADARVAERATRLPESLDPAIFRDSAATLAARGDLAGGLLALALTRAGVRPEWGEPARGMLLDLRQHPDLEVREAAYEVPAGGG
jgi:hypothetical protein